MKCFSCPVCKCYRILEHQTVQITSEISFEPREIIKRPVNFNTVSTKFVCASCGWEIPASTYNGILKWVDENS